MTKADRARLDRLEELLGLNVKNLENQRRYQASRDFTDSFELAISRSITRKFP